MNINHHYATTAANKIMEYLAAGLPMLVSDRPGMAPPGGYLSVRGGADEILNSIAAAVNALLGEPDRALTWEKMAAEPLRKFFAMNGSLRRY